MARTRTREKSKKKKAAAPAEADATKATRGSKAAKATKSTKPVKSDATSDKPGTVKTPAAKPKTGHHAATDAPVAAATPAADPCASSSSRPTPEEPRLSHADVARRAYLIWCDNGRPDGCDQAHWFEAERSLILEMKPWAGIAAVERD